MYANGRVRWAVTGGRAIAEGEEILIDYGAPFWQNRAVEENYFRPALAAHADPRVAAFFNMGLRAANACADQAALDLRDANTSLQDDLSYEDSGCRVCSAQTHPEKILLCDGCDAQYHTFCLTPQLQHVPAGDWYCPDCVAQHAYAGPSAPRSVCSKRNHGGR